MQTNLSQDYFLVLPLTDKLLRNQVGGLHWAEGVGNKLAVQGLFKMFTGESKKKKGNNLRNTKLRTSSNPLLEHDLALVQHLGLQAGKRASQGMTQSNSFEVSWNS